MTKQIKKLPPVQNRAEIVRRLIKHKEEIKSFRVARLGLFGSAARDQLRRRSDVDVLVEFSTLDIDNYFGLKFFLEDLLGRKIDLVREKAIKPRMMPYVQEDLYAIAP
ncbi:MAG: nucleotidyltransferase family protein [Chloroflexi bacterium]|nr:nucleotidyltransferase family protein [Chloroflexota bacterium]MBI3340791.1 nucleotidyltransferase family protein [Chloroflexota bacterium]